MDLLADYLMICDAFLKEVNKVSLKCFDSKLVYFYMSFMLSFNRCGYEINIEVNTIF